MLRPLNPLQESVARKREGGGAAGAKRRRSEWDQKKRDELGEMRVGMNPGLLVSQDFRTVNRHFYSAFEKVLKPRMSVSPYCEEIVKKTLAAESLVAKKLLFLTMLCMFPEVSEYYANNCPPSKFLPWVSSLRENLDIFLAGKHRDMSSKCEHKTDAKYRSIAHFVGAMTARYVNL